MSGLMYVLEVMCKDIDCQVSLNDVNVLYAIHGPARTSQKKVNPYIIDGKNELSLNLRLRDENSVPEGSSPEVNITLMSGVQGTEPGSENILSKFTLDIDSFELHDKFEKIWTSSFSSIEPHSKRLWESADSIDLNDKTRRELNDFVQQIILILKNKNLLAFKELLDTKNHELAKSLDISKEKLSTGFDKYLNMLFSDSTWSVEEIGSDDLEFVLSENKKVVSVYAQNGLSPIHASASGRPFKLDVNVAKVDGAWVVIP